MNEIRTGVCEDNITMNFEGAKFLSKRLLKPHQTFSN